MNNNYTCMNRNQNQSQQNLRNVRTGCGCTTRDSMQNTRSTSSPSAIPTGSRSALLCYINEVSFAVYETLLYLDTHPTDQAAMEFFQEHSRLREHALKEYARLYGPLTVSMTAGRESDCWEWMNQPWPWEGGDC